MGRNATAQSLYFPPTTGTTWQTTDPTQLGWCQDSIASLINFLQQENSKAFIVLKDGRIVIEHYFGTFTQDSVWYWASAGKSLSAFLVGRAQEEGFLSINDRTSDHLGTGWTSCPSEKEDLITIRHQLTMTTGLNDAGATADCTTPQCLQYMADAGTRWAYHNAPYTLTHAVVEAASGITFNQFTNTYIKQQTGMNGLWWTSNYNDVYYSTARSMARFALLIQNNGVWNGDTLMHDQQYFHDMTHPSQLLNESYGYLWWLNGQSTFMIPQSQFVLPGPAVPSAPSDMIAALGKNGQIASISQSEGLVFIRMGNDNGTGGLISLTLAEDIWYRLNRLSCFVGLNDASPATDLGVYPNPVLHRLVLSGKALATGTPLTLLNSLGQTLQVLHLAPDRSIDVSHLSTGIYFLRAEGSTIWFVKQ